MSIKLIEKTWDAIVVGAGPAGCSTAFFIARAGHEVLLLDKSGFPRDKVCGDGISSSALGMVKRIGVLDGMMVAIKPMPAWGVTIVSPDRSVMKSPIPDPGKRGSSGYVIPRKKFDSILLDHLISQPGVTMLQDFCVTGLLYDQGRVCGVKCGHDNNEVHLKSRFVIGADGAHSVIAKRLSLFNSNPKHRAFAVRAYFENVQGLENRLEIYYDKAILPGYGWIFPTGPTSANVGVGISTRFGKSRGLKELFQILVEKNSMVKDKLKNGYMVKGSLKGWPLPCGSFPSKRSAGNVLLAGDAGSFIDPLTGEGIYCALRSGELAATAVNAGLTAVVQEDAVGKMYDTLWKREFKWKEFFPGYVLQSFLTKQSILNFCIKRGAAGPRIASLITEIFFRERKCLPFRSK